MGTADTLFSVMQFSQLDNLILSKNCYRTIFWFWTYCLLTQFGV